MSGGTKSTPRLSVQVSFVIFDLVVILKNVPWMIPPWNGIYVGVVSQWLRFNLASHFASEHVTYLIPRFAFPTKHGVFASVLDSRPRGWITLVKGDHDGAIVPLRRCGLWQNYCGLLSAARRLCHGPLAIGASRPCNHHQRSIFFCCVGTGRG